MRPWLKVSDQEELNLAGMSAVDAEMKLFLAWAYRHAESLGLVLGEGVLGFLDGASTCDQLGLWLLCCAAHDGGKD